MRTLRTTVVEGELHRIRQGRERRFAAAPRVVSARRPAQIAVTLAFAHEVERAIASGEAKDQADAARRCGLTRARLSQILDLTRLAPDLQQEILFLEVVDGRQPFGDRALRPVLRHRLWADQRAAYRRLRPPL